MKRLIYIFIVSLSMINFLSASSDSLYDHSKIIPKTLPVKPSEVYTGKDFIYQEQQYEKQVGFFTNFINQIFKAIGDFINRLLNKVNIPNIDETNSQASFFIIIVLAIGLVVIFFFTVKKNLGKNDKKIISIEEVEQNINEVNFEQLIKNAILEKNYRLALRFYYLKILKMMSDSELIQYEYQKTNYEYFYEIKHPTIKDKFKETYSIFDYYWYGNHRFEESDFLNAKNSFNEIQNLISHLGRK